MTQATGIKNVLLDLAAVRLASLNQTLDPWLYILLRRSTCMSITRGVGQIKTKCLKVAGMRFQESELSNENDAQNIIQNCQKGRTFARVNFHPIPEELPEKNIPQPDVMQIVGGGKRSPLPDITNTVRNKEKNDPCYVCHFQFGKSVSPKEDEGMYVKILHLKNNSLTNIYNGKTLERPVLCHQSTPRQFNDNLMLPVVMPQNFPEPHTNFDDCRKKSLEMGTKDTSVSQDISAVFQSENTMSPSDTRYIHESLRKTKSSNK